jgi:hypothetical protein
MVWRGELARTDGTQRFLAPPDGSKQLSGTCEFAMRLHPSAERRTNFGRSTYHDMVQRPPDTGRLRRELTLFMQSSTLRAMPAVSARSMAQDAFVVSATLPGRSAAAGQHSETVIGRTPVIDA